MTDVVLVADSGCADETVAAKAEGAAELLVEASVADDDCCVHSLSAVYL